MRTAGSLPCEVRKCRRGSFSRLQQPAPLAACHYCFLVTLVVTVPPKILENLGKPRVPHSGGFDHCDQPCKVLLVIQKRLQCPSRVVAGGLFGCHFHGIDLPAGGRLSVLPILYPRS